MKILDEREMQKTIKKEYLLLQRYFFFASQIKNENLSRKCLISYDVNSLLINIPLQKNY